MHKPYLPPLEVSRHDDGVVSDEAIDAWATLLLAIDQQPRNDLPAEQSKLAQRTLKQADFARGGAK